MPPASHRGPGVLPGRGEGPVAGDGDRDRRRAWGIALAACIALPPVLALSPPGGGAASPELFLEVGPDVQVSIDGEFPHVEYVADAHPTDPDVVVVGAITLGNQHDVSNRAMLRTYATADGGHTWRYSEFDGAGDADPALVFAPDGAVYFTGIGMALYRSRGGGMPGSWEAVGDPIGGDHPMMTADPTDGRYRGRLYIHMAGGTSQAIDPGEDPVFHPRRRYREREPGMSFAPLVLDDGSVFLPFVVYDSVSEDRYDAVSRFVWSDDGGETFGPPGQILRHRYHGYEEKRVAAGSFLPWAINPSFALDRTRGRIYMAWDETESTLTEWLEDPAAHPPNRVRVTYSDDRGRTWSEPVQVDPAAPAHSAQYMAAVAVNRDGVVGVLWLDTRGDPRQLTYHAYFAASADGRTFTEPRRLGAPPSHPLGAGNLRLVFHGDGTGTIGLDSAYRRWAPGGDYIWMTADADGVFHPFWPDAREGVFQVYTARVRASPEPFPPTPPSRAVVDVTDSVEVRFDGTRYDSAGAVVRIPIRLRNLSSRTLVPPIRVEWIEARALSLLDVDGGDVDPAEGIAYGHSLGDAGMLPPGAVTGARVWRFRHTGLQQSPAFEVRVMAGVAEGAGTP